MDESNYQLDQPRYICLTATALDNNFKMHRFVLSCTAFNQHHTGTAIAEQLANSIDSWGLTDRISCIIRDNAANMESACAIGQYETFGCVAHTANLCVKG